MALVWRIARYVISTWAGVSVTLAIIASGAHATLDRSQLEHAGLAAYAGQQLPLQVTLTSEANETRQLKNWLGDVPTIWISADYTCTTLCGPLISVVSNALADSGLRAGTDFRLIVFGLDPKDTAEDALAMKAAQLSPRDDLPDQSVFLRGSSADTSELLTALGIRTSYDAERDQFAHPVAVFVVTPEGRIARALSGIALDPETFRGALVDAGHGRVGGWSDRVRLLCYGFDPATGIYTPAVWRVLAGAGVITMITLIALVALLIRRDASPKPG
ncbi:SCO family protein [Bradyrhizobium sp. NAS96.2]|uniref:SCO family protein n=1 Tax=Bradyrhizobium sp. NAS96.2 TaxID=1680160 RepID=UPI0011614423|nr:SCO family protein [Bradyrhizobium sp. NAS96.2]